MSDFWARRKAAVAAEARLHDAALQETERAAEEAAQAEKTDAELLEDLGLPDPDLLETSAELRAFLLPSIPRRLKTRALRRMWRLNPVLANLDGLVDYGEDYTDAAMVPEVLATSYQVGRGLTRHVEELARQSAAPEAAPTNDATEDEAPERPSEAPEPVLARDEGGAMPPDPAPDMPARRRIRITYADPAGGTA